MKALRQLYLVANDQLTELEPDIFSSLVDLEKLILCSSKLRHFDLKIMDYIVNIKELALCHSPVDNKEEISDHFKQLNIDFRI